MIASEYRCSRRLCVLLSDPPYCCTSCLVGVNYCVLVSFKTRADQCICLLCVGSLKTRAVKCHCLLCVGRIPKNRELYCRAGLLLAACVLIFFKTTAENYSTLPVCNAALPSLLFPCRLMTDNTIFIIDASDKKENCFNYLLTAI